MKTLWRLSTVLETGTMNWEKRVQLWFQLSHIDVTPQDPALPIYKQFAKTPYGGLLVVGSPEYEMILDGLGCEEDGIDCLISKAGTMLDIEYEEEDYKWKTLFIVKSLAISEEKDIFDWWVDIKTFKFSPTTTLLDIKELWFDAKNVKNSDEYNLIKQRIMEDEEVPF